MRAGGLEREQSSSRKGSVARLQAHHDAAGDVSPPTTPLAFASSSPLSASEASTASAPDVRGDRDRDGFDESDSVSISYADTQPSSVLVDESQLVQRWASLWADLDMACERRRKELSSLMRSGVPRDMRHLVWTKVVGADHSPAREQYALLVAQSSPHEESIRNDIRRTFPFISFFADDDGEGQTLMFDVLKAYSLYDPDLGYCQGMPYIVGVLLTQRNMTEEDSFAILVRIIQDCGLRGWYTQDMTGLETALFQLDRLLKELCPALFAHFHNLGVQMSMFASQWFVGMFGSTLPLTCTFGKRGEGRGRMERWRQSELERLLGQL
jgi:hypothetical protein